MILSNEIGKLIKQARIQRGYTQQKLADLVGVQKSAVAKWENGRVTEIKRTNLIALADALGIEDVLLVGNAYADKKEKPSVDEGLSESHIKLIEFAKNVPADKAELILQVMKTIVEGGK